MYDFVYSRMLFNFSNEIMTARTTRENLIRDLRSLLNNREGGEMGMYSVLTILVDWDN